PEMPQKQSDLLVGELENRRRDPLLERPLAEDPQLTQPQIDARGLPPVAVAREQQLMPISAAGVAGHCHPALILGCAAPDGAACVGGGRIPHWLMLRIPSVADEVRQQGPAVSGPFFGILCLRELARDRQTVAGPQISALLPAERAVNAILSGGPD